MKVNIISLSLLSLLWAGIGLAAPVDNAVDDTTPEVGGEDSIQEILRGTCSSVTQQCTAQKRPGSVYHAPCPRDHRCGARHTCNIDTIRLTAVCS
ncbi:uncharacterized protein BP01DRAFT_423957 [Aspergillus saccharolyticus JOP 1030-1]|uniref:Uncharacterized protein n=1 Tax=Aspergillus saccharolyticus JOP 1030-1 TaxID=1450539 RepID=A0A318ZX94_9EURO|nr:hypothetical protein BP01DRAFT_423957 [Aspergillus saccharolyticus JOP 1030-1]PYH44758.1 hypothetical protein BP01DRAFT_423957 [Aspergillus saccharolyticus JOP 1030-1]